VTQGSCRGLTGAASAALVDGVTADDVALARRARTTLLAAVDGRLVVADGRRRSPQESVAVFDDGGEAILLVPRGGHLVEAARGRRHAALLVDGDPEFGVGVTLVGRLGVERPNRPRADTGVDSSIGLDSSAGVDQIARTDDRVAVALTVERVLVSCPYDELSVTTKTRRPIPLDVYALAEPDRVTVEIVRTIPHLNSAHADEVRALAAFCADVPAADVLGAELVHLCRNGFGLRWVGRDGGDEERFRFPQPARDVAEVADRLQAYVGAAPN
jgi:Protein of unknown function (DUF2470)